MPHSTYLVPFKSGPPTHTFSKASNAKALADVQASTKPDTTHRRQQGHQAGQAGPAPYAKASDASLHFTEKTHELNPSYHSLSPFVVVYLGILFLIGLGVLLYLVVSSRQDLSSETTTAPPRHLETVHEAFVRSTPTTKPSRRGLTGTYASPPGLSTNSTSDDEKHDGEDSYNRSSDASGVYT
ncbi:hypothetical protein MTO96_015033 [Rhipicephalus appendiculatus]